MPKRGEVRANKSRRFYVLGPHTPDYDDPNYRHPIVPLTNLVEVEGRWIGQKFGVETTVVDSWPVVSAPVD